MTKTLPMTSTMTEALHAIYSHGGVVERRPGGYWTWPQCLSNGGVPITYFGTTTIEALVTRGKLAYTKRERGRRHEFPVEAQCTASASEQVAA